MPVMRHALTRVRLEQERDGGAVWGLCTNHKVQVVRAQQAVIPLAGWAQAFGGAVARSERAPAGRAGGMVNGVGAAESDRE